MIYKIVIIAIVCIFVSSAIKKQNPEISNLVSVCGGVLIFLLCIDELNILVNYFKEIYGFIEIDFEYFSLILKVVGIGYIVEFTADIAEDFGNSVIASKVILGGKIVVCGMMLPIIKKLLTLFLSVLYHIHYYLSSLFLNFFKLFSSSNFPEK